MRKTLSLILAGGLALLGSCNSQSSPPSAKDKFTQQVEREIRKNDNWVVEEVKSDYRDEGKKASISLKRVSQDDLKKLDEMGFIPAAGYYNHTTNNLKLPDFSDGEQRLEVIDAIDHELWHGLYDNEGDKGIINRTGYNGPTLEEIAAFSKAKSEGEEFNTLREGLFLFAETRDISHLRRLLSAHLTYGENAIKGFVETAEKVDSDILVNPNLTEEEAQQLSSRRDNLVDGLRPLISYMKSLDVRYEAESKTLREKKAEEIRAEDISAFKRTIESMNNGLREYDDAIIGAIDFERYTFDLQRTLTEREYNKSVESLRALMAETEDEGLKEEIRVLLDEQDSFRKISESGYEALEQLADSISPSDLQKLEEESIAAMGSDNRKRIAQVLGDPNEFMARVVDSLYSLHFGKVEQNKFPLDEGDLAFLGRFSYEGRPLFRKGIEKYQLGLEMIASGKSPDEVKQTLEYATSFMYEGRRFNWPESNFTIKGDIPYDN